MELQVAKGKGAAAKLTLDDAVFACEYREPLIHQVVTNYQNNARAGTKAQKTRHTVRGGGIKPWGQKGTGRARAGTIRSPLWRGGARIFAAAPRDHSQKVNRKMFNAAMASMLSEMIRQERLSVVPEIKLDQAKTKLFVQFLKDLSVKGRVLLVVDQFNAELTLAARNIYWVKLIEAKQLDPLSLVSADKVVATAEAMRQLQERFA